MKEIIEQTKADFKDFFNFDFKNKAEKIEFIKAFFGGLMVMASCYVLYMMIYFLAPAGYWYGF